VRLCLRALCEALQDQGVKLDAEAGLAAAEARLAAANSTPHLRKSA
jgi:hypothetical protein